MTDKSRVSIEQQVCLACGITFDTGNLLLDKRLLASLARYTTTGWGLCAEHQRMQEAGFVALVECDPERSGLLNGATAVKPEQAFRTGRLAHLKREKFAAIFNLQIETNQVCVFVEPGVIERLQSMMSLSAD